MLLSLDVGKSRMICLNTISDDKIMDLSHFKTFADDKLNIAQTAEFAFNRTENIVGKGENAGYQHFLLFLQCFQKASLPQSLQSEIVWQRVTIVH